jgi:hypothetical protein
MQCTNLSISMFPFYRHSFEMTEQINTTSQSICMYYKYEWQPRYLIEKTKEAAMAYSCGVASEREQNLAGEGNKMEDRGRNTCRQGET